MYIFVNYANSEEEKDVLVAAARSDPRFKTVRWRAVADLHEEDREFYDVDDTDRKFIIECAQY